MFIFNSLDFQLQTMAHTFSISIAFFCMPVVLLLLGRRVVLIELYRHSATHCPSLATAATPSGT